MKQLILTILLSILVINGARAAKAYTGFMTMKQSDGTTIKVRMYGDENAHWYATTDGALVVRQNNDFFVAAVEENGSLSSTRVLAHNKDMRQAEESRLIATQQRDKFFRYVDERNTEALRREPIGTANPSYFPHSGTPTAVVVLVEFNDVKFTVNNPQEVFDQYLNAEQLDDFGHGEQSNYGSVAQYFDDMSFGQYRPKFAVYGPVTLPNDMAYYGENSGSSTDIYFSNFLQDAATAADEIVDFSSDQFDSDGDGYVDLVYFIYAGYGESNGADVSTIWPKSGTSTIGVFDGKTLCRYGVNNELNMYPDFYTDGNPKINGIGLFCHEFSHTLGLPDLYPTVASAQVDNQEMEYWSLMDGGEYVYYGYYPTAYTSWEREAMGWKSIETISADTHFDMKALDNGGTSYKFCNPNDETDYMVMDVVENTGWNKHVPGHGLLVYHVCWPTSDVTLSQRPNNTAGKPAMAVVPADGIVISSYNDSYTSRQYRKSHGGDPFPGDSLVTTLSSDLALPNYTWYSDDSVVLQGLSNISEDTETGVVSFDFKTDIKTNISNIGITPHSKAIYDLQGRKWQQDANISRGIYIVNGRKIAK